MMRINRQEENFIGRSRPGMQSPGSGVGLSQRWPDDRASICSSVQDGGPYGRSGDFMSAGDHGVADVSRHSNIRVRGLNGLHQHASTAVCAARPRWRAGSCVDRAAHAQGRQAAWDRPALESDQVSTRHPVRQVFGQTTPGRARVTCRAHLFGKRSTRGLKSLRLGDDEGQEWPTQRFQGDGRRCGRSARTRPEPPVWTGCSPSGRMARSTSSRASGI